MDGLVMATAPMGLLANAADTVDPADVPLMPLRPDLRLAETARNASGEPAWVIQDTVLNRFFRIGWFEFECLLRWHGTPREVCEAVCAETPMEPDVAQVLALNQFLARNDLLRPDAQARDRLARQARGQGPRWLTWRWWLHHYLFFRIPLVRPQRVLAAVTPHLGWLFHRATAVIIALLGLLGVVLVLHQWDTFTHDVVESFSTEGLLSFAAALIVAKTLHELAHALVATRLGVKVAHMGIAFVVMWPMLYTDTGESWKLTRARQRLAIASAGILCEIALAGLASLGWALSEPGPWRNGLLYLATTSWALSLALNASPFMRFDGYFILTDLLDFPNLHERASAQARVALRRAVLGLREPWPEAFPPQRRHFLIAFAMVTWLYRLVLFVGIAVAVYLFFFKLLGILLFAVEIVWFVIAPVWREMRHWWAHRASVPGRRRHALLAVAGLAVLLLALPWRTQIHAVGVARSAHQVRVFAPFASRVVAIQPPGTVKAGDSLAVLEEPDISSRIGKSEAARQGMLARLSGLVADASGLEQQAVTRERLRVQMEEGASARLEIARLSMIAPFAGRWMDVDPDRKPGQWIGNREAIGILFDPAHWEADAYVKQDEMPRIQAGSRVRFYQEGQPTPIAGEVIAIDSTRAKQLSHPMLAARHHGPVTTAAAQDSLTPNPALFHVLVRLDGPPVGLREARGQLQIDGERRSPLAEAFRHLSAALLRESAF